MSIIALWRGAQGTVVDGGGGGVVRDAVTVVDSSVTSTLPTGVQSGDVILSFAYRANNATPPTIFPGYVDLGSVSSNPSVRVGYWAYDGSGSVSAWTSSTRTHHVALRNVDLTQIIGVTGANAGTATSLAWDGLDTEVDDDTSIVIRGGVHNDAETPVTATSHTALEVEEVTNRGYITQYPNDRSDPASATSAMVLSGGYGCLQVETLGARTTGLRPVGATTGTTAPAIPATAQSGDLLVVFAARSSTTIPTTPGSWTDILSDGSGATIKVAYRVWDGVFTAPTWTNASRTVMVALRGQNVSPIGSSDTQNGSGTTATWDALGTAVTDDTSVVLRYVYSASGSGAPTLTAAHGAWVTSAGPNITNAVLCDALRTDPGARSVTVPSANWRTAQVEVKA